MTENGYLVWIIAMAIMTIFVLTVGTLAAADVFSRGKREEGEEERPDLAAADPEQRHLPAA